MYNNNKKKKLYSPSLEVFSPLCTDMGALITVPILETKKCRTRLTTCWTLYSFYHLFAASAIYKRRPRPIIVVLTDGNNKRIPVVDNSIELGADFKTFV